MSDIDQKAAGALEAWALEKLGGFMKEFDAKGQALGLSDKRRSVLLCWGLFGFAAKVAKQIGFAEKDALDVVRTAYK